MDKQKARKVVKALETKKRAKLSPTEKKHLAELTQKKQVGNFKMPDAPESKKGKGKKNPCSLSVPPPPVVHQPRKLRSSSGVVICIKEDEDDDVIECKPTDRITPQPILDTSPNLVIPQFAGGIHSEGTLPQTAAESVMNITDVSQEMCPSLLIIPWYSMPEETVAPATTALDSTMDITNTTNEYLITISSTSELETVPPATTAPDSAMDITEATEEILLTIPVPSTPESKTVAFATTTPDPLMDVTNAIEEIVTTPESKSKKKLAIARTPSPRKKKRKIQSMPSKGMQSTVLPQSPEFVHTSENLALTPSTSTSTTPPSSGRSVHRLDVEPGEGSDVEYEGNADSTLTPRNVDEYPVDSDDIALTSIDAENDLALRTALENDQDFLSFDWQYEPKHFQGVREIFTVPSTGPTFDNTDLTPLEVFLKIWDADIIALIVRETNRYVSEKLRCNDKPYSRLTRWKDVNEDEIKKFLAIIMLQSLVINPLEKEYWYPKIDAVRIGNFGAIMPYNRFMQINSCLHFVDNAALPAHPDRLHKVEPIIEHLNKKFSSLYVLEQNIAIDESLFLRKRRLSFAQKNATEGAKVGLKSCEICESRTGYLWRMKVYSGEEQQPAEGHDKGHEAESATSQIVLTLMRPLFNRGHTLVMDNFYNAPLLSRILKVKHKTDSMGTLRLNREFVPERLRIKAKMNMNAGEVAFSVTDDLSVVVCMDKNVFAMISTYHKVKVGGKEKYGYYRYKPQVVQDYNLSMGGIDHKDQMLRAFPIERVKNTDWYRKLFRRLVNISIHNSFVLFNHERTQVVGNRDFRMQLANQLLQICRPSAIPRRLLAEPEVVAPVAPSQMHLPAKNAKQQRCKLCSAAKVRRTTVWRCSTCSVNLCIEGCYTDYHKSKWENFANRTSSSWD